MTLCFQMESLRRLRGGIILDCYYYGFGCFLVYVKMLYMISERTELVGVGGVPDCSKFYSLPEDFYFSMRIYNSAMHSAMFAMQFHPLGVFLSFADRPCGNERIISSM